MLSFFLSCSHEMKQKHVHKELSLNHEILNDSIHYKIKESVQSNVINRDLYIYNINDKLEKINIYKVKKQNLLDEGYNNIKNKFYEILPNKNEIKILNISTHYFDYAIESEDTTVTIITISDNGNTITNRIQ